jgi:hypothetical protein
MCDFVVKAFCKGNQTPPTWRIIITPAAHSPQVDTLALLLLTRTIGVAVRGHMQARRTRAVSMRGGGQITAPPGAPQPLQWEVIT